MKELGDHDIQGQITVQGAIDMEVLAKILRNSFPTLLGDKSTENYEVIYYRSLCILAHY